MRLSDEELGRLYRQATAVGGEDIAAKRSACLTADALVRASRGEMDGRERERTADHLAECADCAREFQLARSSGAWSETIAGPAESSNIAPSVRPSHLHIYALAAALAVVSIGLGIWAYALRREAQLQTAALEQVRRQLTETSSRDRRNQTDLAELRRSLTTLSQPQLNAPIIDLDSRNSVRGASAGQPPVISIPAAAGVFTLILNITGHPDFAGYAVAILDNKGTEIWSGRGLRKSPFNTFTVAIPRAMMPAGSYRIQLQGLGGAGVRLLEDYQLRIQYQ